MKEKDAKVLMDSFSSVAPYIVYTDELRDQIKQEMERCDRVETFLENFRRRVSESTDATRKTDGQIFLNELRRRIQVKIQSR
jgi:molecular chaperone GrpE (heat shock protein)